MILITSFSSKIILNLLSNSKINKTPIAPCGGCRQVISELETKQDSAISMYFMGEEGKVVFTESIENLLPFQFDSSFL